jgi:ZIP family zinc transporter
LFCIIFRKVWQFGIVIAAYINSKLGGDFVSALTLSVGIAVQNIPEGMAISLPYKTEGVSNKKAFMAGMLSGIVEPIAAVITIFLNSLISGILPYLLAFAAGTMLYVIVGELIPSSQEDGKKMNTLFFIVGFLLMMILDVIM